MAKYRRYNLRSDDEERYDAVDTPDWPGRSLIDSISRTYDTTEWAAWDITDRSRQVIELLGGLSKMRGKKILDIGCGCISSPDNWLTRSYEPWMCRVFHDALVGALPVGIDKGAQSGESFPSLALDLKDPDALNIFPDASFDVIVNSNFLSHRAEDRGCSPTLIAETTLDQRDDLRLVLRNQAERLLVDEGVYLQGSAGQFDVYAKENTDLLCRRRARSSFNPL